MLTFDHYSMLVLCQQLLMNFACCFVMRQQIKIKPSRACQCLACKAQMLLLAAGAGWHKAGPDQQLPPHVAWNQVTDAERRSLDGSASAENISRGQQRGPSRTHSYKLPQGVSAFFCLCNICTFALLPKACCTSQSLVHKTKPSAKMPQHESRA